MNLHLDVYKRQGYNYGARNKERLMKTYKEAFKVAVIVMALGTLLFQL